MAKAHFRLDGNLGEVVITDPPVMASEDLQSGARTLLEKGPGQAAFEGR